MDPLENLLELLLEIESNVVEFLAVNANSNAIDGMV